MALLGAGSSARWGGLWLAAGTALLAGLPAMAQPVPAQTPAQAAPTPPKPAAAAPAKPATPQDAAFEAARPAFEALPEAERKGLQDALVWTGDYNSVVNGTFGRRTFDALNAIRARTRTAADILDPRTRASILAAGETARKAARFSVRADPASGVVLGVPDALLPKRSALPGGTRWQSADGRVTLESRSFKAGEASLDALFEKATAVTPGRTVTYKLKRPDFVVVTGETAGGKFYIRHAAGAEGVRGFTFGYDKSLAGDVDRLVIAVANSFVPFPEAGAAAPAPPAAAAKAPMPAATAAAPSGTGLAVAPGRVLTASSVVEGCSALEIRGKPVRVAKTDPAAGLALLDAPGLSGGAAPTPRASAIASGDALVTVSADANGLAVAPGTGSATGGVFAPLQPGAAGAPVLDRSGALAGLVARFPAAPRLVAGVMPPTSHAVVPAAAAVSAFLAGNGVGAGAAPGAGGASLGAIAARVSGGVVAIACRK